MIYEDFLKTVEKRIKEYLPAGDYEIKIQKIPKDRTHLDTLLINSAETSQLTRSVTPCIYLNDYYRQYMEEGNLHVILQKIAKEWKTAVSLSPYQEVEEILDFERIKDCITVSMVNTNSNSQWLSDRPHCPVMGGEISAVYQVDMNRYMVAVTYGLMGQWMSRQNRTIDESELFETALTNTQKRYPGQLKTMSEHLAEIGFPTGGSSGDELYILSNGHSQGAAALLYPGMLERAEEKIGEFYILPSSVHEAILCPKTIYGQPADIDFLKKTVQDINQSTVAPQDRLADNVFVYHKDQRKIVPAADQPVQEQKKEAEKPVQKRRGHSL